MTVTSFVESALANTAPRPSRKLTLTIPAEAISGAVDTALSVESRMVTTETVDKMVTLQLTGGKEVPPNKDWTATVLANTNYVGLVEFRCINGTVQFRGSLKGNISAAGSYTAVRSFVQNDKVYAPELETNLTAFAIDTGTTYRVAAVRFGTDGSIALSAPTGKFDTVRFDGLSYQVF